VEDSIRELIVVLILIVGAIIIKVLWQNANASKAQLKKELYVNLLNKLRKDSNNGELKAKVLDAGRDYYSTLREDHCLTVYLKSQGDEYHYE
jgi:predicted negative regulator of RcsB-dependent stress response